jgi:hypothetical protein
MIPRPGDDAICACGHTAKDHVFGLFVAPCFHENTPEEWFSLACRCSCFRQPEAA